MKNVLYDPNALCELRLTWNTTIVYGFSDSSTVHLGSSGAYTEFASIKLLLVDILSNSTTDSVVGDEKNRVVLPCICQVYSHLRIPVTCPEPQDSSAHNSQNHWVRFRLKKKSEH